MKTRPTYNAKKFKTIAATQRAYARTKGYDSFSTYWVEVVKPIVEEAMELATAITNKVGEEKATELFKSQSGAYNDFDSEGLDYIDKEENMRLLLSELKQIAEQIKG